MENELLYNIEKSLCDFENHCAILERAIKDKVKFEFSITPVGGDGMVILKYDTANVSPLGQCLEVIKKTGELTIESHNSLGI